MIAAVTELHLKNFWAWLRFVVPAVRSKIQADRAPGIVSVRVDAEGLSIQRTLTVWQSEEAMWTYVRSRAHVKAMKMFRTLANTSYTAHFPVAEVPTWEGALAVLKTRGRQHG